MEIHQVKWFSVFLRGVEHQVDVRCCGKNSPRKNLKGDAAGGPATEFRISIKICASWLAGQSCVRMNTMWKPQLVNYSTLISGV